VEDNEFIERFEGCTLRGADFHHRDHVRIVWLYLQSNSVLETLARFSAGLKRLAAADGKPSLYHETITWAYVFLIHGRMERKECKQSWRNFVAANPDLFDWKDNILKSYYHDDTLKSETARRTFVFPDRFTVEVQRDTAVINAVDT
jgi:hypothetical protein